MQFFKCLTNIHLVQMGNSSIIALMDLRKHFEAGRNDFISDCRLFHSLAACNLLRPNSLSFQLFRQLISISYPVIFIPLYRISIMVPPQYPPQQCQVKIDNL